MRTGVMLSTVEHLLAALRGLAVDNVIIEVDNLEIPIMDGSAENFAEIIERAGIADQPLARRALLVREKVFFEQGNRRISIEPADTYQIDCLIEFTHPRSGVQSLSVGGWGGAVRGSGGSLRSPPAYGSAVRRWGSALRALTATLRNRQRGW